MDLGYRGLELVFLLAEIHGKSWVFSLVIFCFNEMIYINRKMVTIKRGKYIILVHSFFKAT